MRARTSSRNSCEGGKEGEGEGSCGFSDTEKGITAEVTRLTELLCERAGEGRGHTGEVITGRATRMLQSTHNLDPMKDHAPSTLVWILP